MMIQEELLPIKQIEEYPTDRDMVHESIFQSYYILKHVKTMLNRGDSKETIIGFILHFDEKPKLTTT